MASLVVRLVAVGSGAEGTAPTAAVCVYRQPRWSSELVPLHQMLFGCGEATARCVADAGVKLIRLSHVCLSSGFVGDVAGMPSLLFGLAERGAAAVTIISPVHAADVIAGVGSYVRRRHPAVTVVHPPHRPAPRHDDGSQDVRAASAGGVGGADSGCGREPDGGAAGSSGRGSARSSAEGGRGGSVDGVSRGACAPDGLQGHAETSTHTAGGGGPLPSTGHLHSASTAAVAVPAWSVDCRTSAAGGAWRGVYGWGGADCGVVLHAVSVQCDVPRGLPVIPPHESALQPAPVVAATPTPGPRLAVDENEIHLDDARDACAGDGDAMANATGGGGEEARYTASAFTPPAETQPVRWLCYLIVITGPTSATTPALAAPEFDAVGPSPQKRRRLDSGSTDHSSDSSDSSDPDAHDGAAAPTAYGVRPTHVLPAGTSASSESVTSPAGKRLVIAVLDCPLATLAAVCATRDAVAPLLAPLIAGGATDLVCLHLTGAAVLAGSAVQRASPFTFPFPSPVNADAHGANIYTSHLVASGPFADGRHVFLASATAGSATGPGAPAGDGHSHFPKLRGDMAARHVADPARFAQPLLASAFLPAMVVARNSPPDRSAHHGSAGPSSGCPPQLVCVPPLHSLSLRPWNSQPFRAAREAAAGDDSAATSSRKPDRTRAPELGADGSAVTTTAEDGAYTTPGDGTSTTGAPVSSPPPPLIDRLRAAAEPIAVFLGTGAAAPSSRRGCSGILLATPAVAHAGARPPAGFALAPAAPAAVVASSATPSWTLLDCGEGVASRLHITSPGWEELLVPPAGRGGAPSSLTVWVSHMHADHHSGLLPLLASLALRGPVRLRVVGPPALGALLPAYLQLISVEAAACRRLPVAAVWTWLSLAVTFQTLPAPGVDYALPHAFPVAHSCRDAYGCAARWLAAPAQTATASTWRGAVWVYSGDTRPCDAVPAAAAAAAVAVCTEYAHLTASSSDGGGVSLPVHGLRLCITTVHEATFADDAAGDGVRQAKEKAHSTREEAVTVWMRVREAVAAALSGAVGVRVEVAHACVLTHISQRYGDREDGEEGEGELWGALPAGVTVAEDGMVVRGWWR